jgi:hypothetical protein
MKILSNQFLGRGWLRHILNYNPDMEINNMELSKPRKKNQM